MAGGGVPECTDCSKRDSPILPARNFAGPARVGISAANSLFLTKRRGSVLPSQW